MPFSVTDSSGVRNDSNDHGINRDLIVPRQLLGRLAIAHNMDGLESVMNEAWCPMT